METNTIARMGVMAVVLAGGRATRMGGEDKGLLILQGKPLVAHAIARIRSQVESIVISANRHRQTYMRYGYPVLQDSLDDYQGPLAGLLSALQVMKSPAYFVLCPCDSPALPRDLVTRMREKMDAEGVDIAVAHDGERLQPIFLMVHRNCRESLEQFMQSGERKIAAWFKAEPHVEVDFSDCPQSFTNINTPDELQQFEAGVTP